MFDIKKLSIEEEENFEHSLLVYGYYDDKYFALDITDDSFSLLYDDTECTDEELQNIFDYLVSRENLN